MAYTPGICIPESITNAGLEMSKTACRKLNEILNEFEASETIPAGSDGGLAPTESTL